MNVLDQMKLNAEIAKAFTPSAPIDDATLFAGRVPQLLKVITAINQRGQHVVIYGERGVGKTSLANILYETLNSLSMGQYELTTVNCDANITFSSLWKSVARDLWLKEKAGVAGFTASAETFAADELLPADVGPDDVRRMFQQLSKSAVVIIDEVDRARGMSITTPLADTIKSLSDHSVDVTLILVGVADSVDDLIAEHLSVERALVQIQMPRMSTPELFEIVDKALAKVGMTIDDDAKKRIAQLSQGLPHYTHLLGLHAAQHAVNDGRGRTFIEVEDVKGATRLAVDQAQQSIVRAYHKATSSPRGNLYPQVLLACALAPSDDLGYFSSSEVREPMSLIMGRHYDIPAFARHLNDFCENTRGPILQRTGYPRRYKFRFLNPLMEPYVIMNGLKKELITDEQLEAIRGSSTGPEQPALLSDAVS
jgi:energy-coupling factor transporter ATP-binding protein EcfA2